MSKNNNDNLPASLNLNVRGLKTSATLAINEVSRQQWLFHRISRLMSDF